MERVKKLDEFRFLIPKTGKMRTEGLVYASDRILQDLGEGNALEQVVNVATLPGIVGRSLAMPDIHWGYGFPIGGVAGFDVEGEGVISPGGVGYDINCGVRLLRTTLHKDEAEPHIDALADNLYANIPSGVGSHRLEKWSPEQLRKVMLRGARWAVEQGMGYPEDLDHIESRGTIPGALPEEVSERAITRGQNQIGTLGSGNHFCEVQIVDKIFDPGIADTFGLFEGQVVVMIHTGSRGFGYQVCDDYLRVMLAASRKYGIDLPDRQLCCAPVRSPEGRQYLGAMACAANYAFANRQTITHYARAAFEKTFRASPRDLAMDLVYDVAHNVAKMETHHLNGKSLELCVHRKGATRAFPPGHPELPKDYQKVGQPVFIPGDMGRNSFCLVGTTNAMEETFGSVCHGAGRLLSRHQAKKDARGRDIIGELHKLGIRLRAPGMGTVMEEISQAYKKAQDVVDVVAGAGLAKLVVSTFPKAVIKG